MEYNTDSYWVNGFRPLTGILNISKHNVSVTGSVSGDGRVRLSRRDLAE
jgi:hypothetical protein